MSLIEEIRSRFWVLNRLPLGIFILNKDYRVVFWNKVMREWSGLTDQDILGKCLFDKFSEVDKPKFTRRIDTIFKGGPPAIFSSHLHRYFIELQTKSGQTRLHNTTVTALDNDQGENYLALFTLQDVTELNTRIVEYRKIKDQVLDELRKRKEIEQRLRQEKRFISLLLDTARVLIILMDRDGKIIIFNRACEDLTGYDSREIENRVHVDFLLVEEEREKCMVFFEDNMSGMPDEFENQWKTRDGQKRLIAWTNSLVYDEEGRPEYVLSTGTDITDQRQMQEKIKHMAMHDELTGLGNRNLLQERLNYNVAMADRYKKKFAVLFLDLDGFKKINDEFGHSVGDNVLKDVAKRIVSSVRSSDTVARFGGDEFVVVLSEVNQYHDAINVSKKISCELSKPYKYGYSECSIGVSIGISVYPDDGDDSESVLRLADKAMYRAKTAGSGGYCYLPMEEGNEE
ncbi:MAG: diguanylate cyclase [Desulfonatronovibrio sp. MSAO_Bac4]|nr:MAG: diguanylate cyclase [Desulfonatronovibrio sp. MSAO_Bac4]